MRRFGRSPVDSHQSPVATQPRLAIGLLILPAKDLPNSFPHSTSRSLASLGRWLTGFTRAQRLDWRLATGDWRLATHDSRLATRDSRLENAILRRFRPSQLNSKLSNESYP